jgi:DNA-binding XRE family transcriptional regulator
MPKKYYRIVSREDAVRRARIFAGLTSEEMAKRIGLSRPMLSSIENGAGTSVKTAHKIADCLSKTVEDLFEVLDMRARQAEGSV